MGYLVAMETYVMFLFVFCFVCKVHSIGLINVRTNFWINWYKIDEFRKHAKLVFYLTSSDVNRYVVRHSGWICSDRYFDQGYFETNQTSGLNIMAQTVVFMFLVTLTLIFECTQPGSLWCGYMCTLF